jgi:DNA-binding transcriptional regulator LsrR (DeoR family)
MKELVIEVCELYDEQGMTIMEIVNATGLSEEVVIQVLSDFSETFA